MFHKSVNLLRRNAQCLRVIVPSFYRLSVQHLSQDSVHKFAINNRNSFLQISPSSFRVTRAMCSGAVKNIEIPQYLKLKEDPKIAIIDVREKSEIAETGIIPGGINIPLGEVSDALQKEDKSFEKLYCRKKPSNEDTIIFSCRSGKRSMMAAQAAIKLGYENVLNLSGGWLAWEEYSNKIKE